MLGGWPEGPAGVCPGAVCADAAERKADTAASVVPASRILRRLKSPLLAFSSLLLMFDSSLK
jgi:hypothetical protein